MRLVAAELLKLRRRSGIVLAAFGLTVVPALIMLAVTGGGDADTGGTSAFADEIGNLASLTLVVGVFVGATLGTADLSSGVFRGSRLELFTARLPAGLTIVLAVALVGFAIVVVSASPSGIDRLIPAGLIGGGPDSGSRSAGRSRCWWPGPAWRSPAARGGP